MEQYNNHGCNHCGSSSGIRAGPLRLPPGYRFKPTDEELIIDYLRRKVDNQPLPADCIREVNINLYDPPTLEKLFKPKDGNEMFFFTPRNRKYKNGFRPNRAVIGESGMKGYWKASGRDHEIKLDEKILIGYKKNLVFHRGKHSKNKDNKTDWLMHEYRLPDPSLPRGSGENGMKLDDYVLCKIYHNLRNNKTNADNQVANEEQSDEANQEASDHGHGEAEKISSVGERSTQVDNTNKFVGDYDDFCKQICFNSFGDDGFWYPPQLAQPLNCMSDSSYMKNELIVPPSQDELAPLPLNCVSDLMYMNDEYASTSCTTSNVEKDEEPLPCIFTQDYPTLLEETLDEIGYTPNEFSKLDEISVLDETLDEIRFMPNEFSKLDEISVLDMFKPNVEEPKCGSHARDDDHSPLSCKRRKIV